MSFDPDAHLDSTDSSTFDPDVHLDSPDKAETKTKEEPSALHRAADAVSAVTPVGGLLMHEASGALTNLGATGKIISEGIKGNIHDLGDASRVSERYIADNPPYSPPPNTGASAVSAAFDSNANPLKWPGVAFHKGGQLVTAGLDKAGVPSNISTAAGPIAEGAANVGLGAYGAVKSLGLGKGPVAEPANLGTEGVPRSPYSNVGEVEPVKELAPQIQQTVEQAAQNSPEPINRGALARHLEAQSLPVPVQLTKGQATQNLADLSNEFNRRGTPEGQPIAQRFNAQNGELIQNMNALRDKAAPDVGMNDTETHAQTIIDAYKDKDDAVKADISAKYKALTDANGGQFPVDGVKFVDAADAALKKQMKGAYIPAGIKSDLEQLRGGEPMTFENFENLRTNLASEIRKADRTGDGNAKAAASIVRNTLEQLPMQGGSAEMKQLADTARAAAKARFDALEQDPAYSAAVNDTVEPHKYFQKYVLNASKRDLATLKANVGEVPDANQAIAGGTFNYLKQRAGIIGENNGNFAQAGFNKALEGIKPHLDLLLDPDTSQQLKTLGNVARYSSAQPKGSWFNNSGSAVTLMGEHAANMAEGAANYAAKGLPVGTVARKLLSSRSRRAETEAALAPGAGVGGKKSLGELMNDNSKQ